MKHLAIIRGAPLRKLIHTAKKMTVPNFILYQSPEPREMVIPDRLPSSTSTGKTLSQTGGDSSPDLALSGNARDASWRSLALCSSELARREIPLALAMDLAILPLSVRYEFGETKLLLAIPSEVEEETLRSSLKLVTTLSVVFQPIAKGILEKAIVSAYKTSELSNTLAKISPKEIQSPDKESLNFNRRTKLDLAENKQADVPQILQGIMNLAFQKNASDIHMEALEGNLARVSLRIDGKLIPQKQITLISGIFEKLVRHIKVLCGLDITEHSNPQDGMFECQLGPQKIRIRISILPSLFGQKIAARLLYHPMLDELDLKSSNLLAALDLPGPQEKMFRSAIKKKGGLILLSGPTGSGKSSLLYALVQEMCSEHKNIISIEDPVERSMSEITQVEVSDSNRASYNKIFKSILRQDPDAVIVSEIRDAEAAQTAIEAALSGILVLSTMHASNTIDLILRLLEFKCSAIALGSCLKVISSQRLFPRNCQHCLKQEVISDEISLKLSLPSQRSLYYSAGCPSCELTGTEGRIAAFESCEPSMPLISALSNVYHSGINSESREAMSEALMRASYYPFSDSIRELLLSGKISAENACRVYF